MPVLLSYLSFWQQQSDIPWVDTTPGSGLFFWQGCSSCSSFCYQKGKILYGHQRQDRKVIGVKLQQTISLDMRKNLVSVRRNEEGCSDPCRNAGFCFGRERSHCPEQCMDRQGEKPILIPANEPVNSSEF